MENYIVGMSPGTPDGIWFIFRFYYNGSPEISLYDGEMQSWHGEIPVVTFESAQYVSKEFYDWFTANATQTIETSTFYIYTDIGRLAYQYEPGMTFADFIESRYNTNNDFFIDADGNVTLNSNSSGPFASTAPNIVKPEYPIDKDAYYGFEFSTDTIVCNKYYVSGEWQFNDNIVYRDVNNNIIKFEQNISFISNETQYNKMSLIAGGCMMIVYDSTDLWWANAGEDSYWSNDAYRIVDFGNTPQEVSKEFYEWFTTNATSYTPNLLSTTIMLYDTAYSINFEEGMTWNEWVGSSYNTFGLYADSQTQYIYYSSDSQILHKVSGAGRYAIQKTETISNKTTYTIEMNGSGN